MTPILEVRDLVKHYPKVKAVNGVSFSIPAGVCFGLLGPNGAGKTTTIEMIENIIQPTSGEILYKGKSREILFRQEVGIQFQNTSLLESLTVKETLETFRKLYDHPMDLDFLIEICRLQDILNQNNDKISGGQKQRLLLAMALANNPELVILDEPTTGLDPQARRHLWDIVDQIKKQNKTIIITTHYMEEASILCDQIAIMDQGKIIAHGTPIELLKQHCNGTSITLPKEYINHAVLSDLPWETFEVQEGLEIQTKDLNSCLRELIQRGIDLTNMSVRTQNLEDLFLKLTGKELRS